MITINNLFLKYVRQYYALYDINLKINKGEAVAFVGEDGSGKTSLIRVLTKLDKAEKGEVYIKDIPLKKLNFAEDVSLGYLPTTPIFFENKSVYENFVYVLKLQKEKMSSIENKINNALIEFNIENLKNVQVCDLTLYEKYLVSIARLSFKNLDLLIIDGVLDNLENEQLENIVECISKKLIKKDQTTFILATQKDEIAKLLCKKRLFFENGSIVGEKIKK